MVKRWCLGSFFRNDNFLSICVVFVVPGPFHVLSKVCIVFFMCNAKYEYLFNVPNKLTLLKEKINAYFLPHMEWSDADFSTHMTRRHSFRYQQIAKVAKNCNFGQFLKTTFSKHLFLGVYVIYVTTFKNKKI